MHAVLMITTEIVVKVHVSPLTSVFYTWVVQRPLYCPGAALDEIPPLLKEIAESLVAGISPQSPLEASSSLRSCPLHIQGLQTIKVYGLVAATFPPLPQPLICIFKMPLMLLKASDKELCHPQPLYWFWFCSQVLFQGCKLTIFVRDVKEQ